MLDYLRRRRQEKAKLREEAAALTKLMDKLFSAAARSTMSNVDSKIGAIVREAAKASGQPAESLPDTVAVEEKAKSEDERAAKGISKILMGLYADAARRTMSRVDGKVGAIVRDAA